MPPTFSLERLTIQCLTLISINPPILPSTFPLSIPRKAEVIRHFCIGEGYFSQLFSDSDYNRLLKTLFSSKPPPIFFPIAQVPSCLHYRFDIFVQLHLIDTSIYLDFSDYFLSILQQKGKKWSETVIQSIQSFDFSSDPQTQEFLTALSTLLQKDPPLYRALGPQISQALSDIDYNLLSNTLQSQSIELLDPVDPKFIPCYQLSYINPSNFASFWLNYPLLTSPSGLQFQALICSSEPFPSQSKLMRQTPLLTLVNDSLCKQRHFADIIFSLAHNCLVTRDFPAVASILDQFSDLRPYAFLADYEKLSKDQAFCMEILPYYEAKPFHLNIFQRLRNDSEIIPTLSNLIGRPILSSELKQTSIPRIVKPALLTADLETLARLKSSEFFLVPDSDRDIDFDFIFAFRAIKEVLCAFKGEAPNEEHFHTFLESIESKEIINSVAIDLFSLIYLKGKSGYVCNIQIAEFILTAILSNEKHHQLFEASFARVQNAKLMGSEVIEPCFVPIEVSIFKALDNKEYDVAEVISASSPKYSCICRRAHSISIDSNSEDDLGKIERALCKQEGISALSSADPFLKDIIDKRKILLKSNVLQIVEPGREDEELAWKAEQHFNPSSRDELIIDEKVPLLQSFANYGSMVALSERENGSAMEAIIARAKSWADIKKILGTHAMRKLVNGCKKPSENLINIIEERSFMAAEAIRVRGGLPTKRGVCKKIMGKNDESSLQRLLENSKSEDDLFSILDQADSSGIRISDALSKRLIDVSIKMSKFPVNFIEEVKFRKPDVVSDYQEKLRKDLYFSHYLILFPDDAVTQISGFERGSEEILTELISSDRISEAVVFAGSCKMNSTLISLLSDYVLRRGPDIASIYKIWDVAPEAVVGIVRNTAKSCKNPATIFNFLTGLIGKLRIYEFDNELIEICNSIFTDFFRPGLKSEVLRAASFFKDPSPFMEFVANGIFAAVEASNPTQLENDVKPLFAFKSILKEFSQKSPPLFVASEKIEWIAQLFQCRLSKFRATYRLDGFPSEDCARRLCSICADSDFFDMVLSFSRIWKADIREFVVERAYSCFFLLKMEQGCSFLALKLPQEYDKPQARLSELVEKTKNLLIHPIPNEMIETPFRVELSPMYYNVKCIMDGITSQSIHKQQLIALDMLVQKFYSQSEKLSFYSSYGRFNELFDLWSQVPSNRGGLESGLRDCICPSIASNQISCLWRFSSKRNLPSLGIYEDFFKQNGMIWGLESMYIGLERSEDAIAASVKLIQQSSCWSDMLRRISVLGEAIDRLKAISKGSLMFLSKYETLSSMQKSFVSMGLEMKISFCKNYNLFLSDDAIAPMSLVCLFGGNFILALQISDLHQSLFASIIDRFYEKVELSGEDEVIRIFSLMSKRMDADGYERLARQLLRSKYGREERHTGFCKFILTNIHGCDLQVSLLVEFCYLNEAYALANKLGLKKSLVLIQEKAMEIGNRQIYEKCLQSKMK